jgi:hypothetical protein
MSQVYSSKPQTPVFHAVFTRHRSHAVTAVAMVRNHEIKLTVQSAAYGNGQTTPIGTIGPIIATQTMHGVMFGIDKDTATLMFKTEGKRTGWIRVRCTVDFVPPSVTEPFLMGPLPTDE